MQNIKNDLANYLQHAPQSIQEILFVPQGIHPFWEDNLEILQLANQQLLQPLGILPNEFVFAFIGMHARTVITGKRDSVGFLITNFRILTQTDFSVIGNAQPAQINLFTQTQLAEEISDKAWNDFVIKNTLTIAQEQLFALQNALKTVVEIVLPPLQTLNYLPEEIQKPSDIHKRIKDLGLQDVLKSYEREEKKLKNFAKKFDVSGIIFGMVDKPFFGSVYGVVITQKGITSRDLMEDSVTSTWHDIKKNPATIGEKGDVILAGHQRHVVPSHLTPFVPAIIILINELANGEVRNLKTPLETAIS